jgi:hypothetical protein
VTLDEQVRAGILSGEVDALDLKSLTPPEVEEFNYS